MPEYSFHVDEGNGRQYMTVVVADNAQQAMGRMACRVAPGAETASVEILEILADGTAEADLIAAQRGKTA